jgi:hypothetical protein
MKNLYFFEALDENYNRIIRNLVYIFCILRAVYTMNFK